jgi:hypothetical protein
MHNHVEFHVCLNKNIYIFLVDEISETVGYLDDHSTSGS